MDLGSVLPLLTRELTEQAARRRTFVLRTVYAAILYFCAVWLMLQKLGGWSTEAFSFLGQGEGIFRDVAILQFIGIYLFLPAMTCGVLTSEKERDTLSTLLLTRLGPWSILLGKLFSRLVAMGSFFCLSMPLVAVAYSFGGVEAGQIAALAWTLAITSLQIGSLALACSAWCRTTGAAFMATYLVGAILIMVPPFAFKVMGQDATNLVGAMFGYGGLVADSNGMAYEDPPTVMLIGPLTCLGEGSADRPFGATVVRTTPMLLFAVACLVFARMVLWRRAFVPPSNLLLKAFRSLDALFHRMNQNKFTRGIVLTRTDDALPLTEPIRWREITKRSLGTTRYLVRLLLCLEIVVLIGMLFPYHGDHVSSFAPVYISAWIVWIVAAFVIAIHSTGLIGLEKSRQTIDVLLTTPLTSETIIYEKFAGVSRMIRVFWIPLATVYLFQIWWSSWVGSYQVSDVLFSLVRNLLAMAIYPSLVAWLGFHMGMRCRSQAQATLATIGILAGICLIPLFISAAFGSTDLEFMIGFRWLSPIFVLVESTYQGPYYYNIPSGFSHFYWWLCMLFHYSIAFAALTIMSRRGIKTFASYVSRNEGQIIDDDDIERLAELRRHVVGAGIFQKNHEDE